MTTTKTTRTAKTSKTGKATTIGGTSTEVTALNERYENLQRRLGGLRYHFATNIGNDNVETSEVIRLIDNVIEAS
jgi:hypothetical protein